MLKANKAKMDRKETKVIKALKVTPVEKVRQVLKGKKESKVQLVQRVKQVLKGKKEVKVQLDQVYLKAHLFHTMLTIPIHITCKVTL